jgi:MFS family permease
MTLLDSERRPELDPLVVRAPVEDISPSTQRSAAEVPPRKSASTENRNFGVMGWHQVLMRIGWIFKTETIVMPAMLDLVGGSAWVRGFLPMLNRLGQSVPPMLAANRVKGAKQKRLALCTTSIVMGVSFLALAGLWHWKALFSPVWLSVAILTLYAIFFSSTGINQLVVSTLTGKLIPVRRRGRLMQFSSSIGSVIAVTCAWILLNQWLQPDIGNFTAIFAFAGMLFIASGLTALLFHEQNDDFKTASSSLPRLISDSIRVLKEDRNLLLLSLVACLFGMMMTLFPHYQDIGRRELKLGLDSLVTWVIAQNLGVAAFSIPAGMIADRVGNRRVLKWLMGGLCFVPLLSLILSQAGHFGAVNYFWVFALLGLTPVTMRTLNNYTLELTDRSRQPQYLGILSLFMAGPAVGCSLFVGLLIDLFGFTPTFLMVTLFQVAGFVLCFRLAEPRKKIKLETVPREEPE